MKQIDRDALKNWAEFVEDIKNSTPVDTSMSAAEVEKHRRQLEKNPVEWIKYFFNRYAKYPFAPFQLKAIARLINNPEWYEVLSWSRELAKSTVCMFIIMYLTLTGRKKNVILASNNETNAIRLLAPYRGNLEGNGRIKLYYGEQMNLGDWTEKEFITKGGVAFRALGAGQSPRGSRNEEIRPDCEILDDFDTDEECRNPETLKKKWEWFENALYPTRSISEPTLVLWCGNIIAKDCCIVRAGAMADHWDIVNIRDDEGKSTWPAKNTEESIDRTLSKISQKAQQGEFYNNPVSEGTVFKNCAFGKAPELKKFRFLVIYGDPAPGESKSKKSSGKCVWLMGKHEGKLYVIKGFIGHELNAVFIGWYVSLLQWVSAQSSVPVYCYMENNKLQDPFFRQVFQPLVAKVRRRENISLNIKGDVEKKTDKAVRIEANLEPLDRDGLLIFNETEKDNPHMIELVEQFKLFELTLPYPADGPDCIEGGNRIIENKRLELQPKIAIPRKIINRNKHKR